IDLVFGKDVDYSELVATSVSNPTLVIILSKLLEIFKFFSDANVALLMSVFVGLYFLGIKQGRKMEDLMKSLGKAASSIAMIVMIIAAGGAFKQVLTDSGVADYIKGVASGIEFNPLILGWCVAAIIRLAIGSATVATMTAAGILLPIVASTGVSPELMVLATGSGSLMFSHFNDIGFWMFKEYYNVSIKQTFAIWTVMECLVAIVGLLAALGLSWII
ncbi:MAG: SLC13 family permease, partial [Draconibacterium sp.]|nr:SLC13 family permease [Draconibacterium sp.]